MYIRRKVFSLLSVEGEERYFSTTDYVSEGEEVRLFSEEEKEKVKLGKAGGKGYVRRAIETGGSGYLNDVVGLAAGDSAAKKAAKEGKSEAEVIDAAGKTASAATRGSMAVTGAAGAAGAHYITKNIIKEANKAGLTKEAFKAIEEKAGKEGVQVAKKIAKKAPGIAAGAVALGTVSGMYARGRKNKLASIERTQKKIKNGKKEN